ncbi:MAG: helix-turn-helix transcriptional regulator, partial [Dehalococcoidia bacterium]
QIELIKSIPKYAENARLLIICPDYFQPLAQAAIDRTQIAAHFLIRTEQEITDQLLRATRLALLGKSNTETSASALLPIGRIQAAMNGIPLLTPRENQLLELIANGISNRLIASNLRLSLRTVNSHVAMVFIKLKVNGDQSSNGRVIATIAYHGYRGAFKRLPDSGEQQLEKYSPQIPSGAVNWAITDGIAA